MSKKDFLTIVEQFSKYLSFDIEKIQTCNQCIEVYKGTLIEYTNVLFKVLKDVVVQKVSEEDLVKAIDILKKLLNKVVEIYEIISS